MDSEAETVMQLRNELRDKEMKLTDIRLEALSSAHQLDQLREAMNRMQVSGRQTESQEAAEWQPRGEGVCAGIHTASSFHSGPLYLAFSLPSLAPLVTHYLSGTVMSDCVPTICLTLFLPL